MPVPINIDVEVERSIYIKEPSNFSDGNHPQSDAVGFGYEAMFFSDESRRGSLHRGPVLTITVKGQPKVAYEVVIGDNGVPRFVPAEPDPVTPAFAAQPEDLAKEKETK